jgi:hypothetical protein
VGGLFLWGVVMEWSIERSKERLVACAERWRDGESVSEISRSLGVSVQRVSQLLKRYNYYFPEDRLPRNLWRKRDLLKVYGDLGKIVYGLRRERNSFRSIAERLNESLNRVQYAFEIYSRLGGVPDLGRVYASHVRTGKLDDVLDELLELRRGGASLRELSAKYGLTVGRISQICCMNGVRVMPLRCKKMAG